MGVWDRNNIIEHRAISDLPTGRRKVNTDQCAEHLNKGLADDDNARLGGTQATAAIPITPHPCPITILLL